MKPEVKAKIEEYVVKRWPIDETYTEVGREVQEDLRRAVRIAMAEAFSLCEEEIKQKDAEIDRLLIYCDPQLGVKYEKALALLAACKPYMALTGIGMYEDRAKILDEISDLINPQQP